MPLRVARGSGSGIGGKAEAGDTAEDVFFAATVVATASRGKAAVDSR